MYLYVVASTASEIGVALMRVVVGAHINIATQTNEMRSEKNGKKAKEIT